MRRTSDTRGTSFPRTDGGRPPEHRRRRPGRRRGVAAAVALALLVPACGGGEPNPSSAGGEDEAPVTTAAPGTPEPTLVPGRLSISTGGTSGVYFVLGGGLAQLITSRLKGIEATAEVTSASVDNLLLLADGDSDLAFALADSAADAADGEGAFDKALDLRALARLYTNVTQVVTTADSGIETVADLAGKRVSTGSPNSGTEVIADRILEVAKVKVKREQLGVGESVSALRDGVIDAFFWSGGLPTGGITDLSSTHAVRLLPLDGVLAGMVSRFGDIYQPSTVPRGTYGLVADVASIGVANYLVVRPDMADELAYRITKLLFEAREELAAVHPEARNITVEKGPDTVPLRLHPGAQRYYAEAG